MKHKITIFSILLFLLFIIASDRLYAQGNSVAPDKTIFETKLTDAIKTHIDGSFAISTDAVSTEGTDNILSGIAACLGVSNMNFRAVFNSSNVLMSFNASVPPGTSPVNWRSIPFVSKIYPDTGLLKIPDVIRNNLNLGKAAIEFTDDAAKMSKVNFELAYNANWTILNEAKLSLSNITVGIEADPASPTSATGTLSGNFSMAGTAGVQISSTLSKNIGDWKISANIADFSFAELLDNFNFTESAFPNAAVFSKIMGTTNLSLDVFPFKQKLSMTIANISFGTLNIQAERLEGTDVAASTTASTRLGWGLLAGYSFPTEFAFNSDKVEEPWRGALSFLDKLKNKTGIYFSTYEGEPVSMLPIFEELGFEGPIYKGITFITGMNISSGYQDLKRILANTTFKKLLVSDVPVDNLTLQANLPMDPMQMRVEAAVQFKESFNLGEIVWLRDIKLILEANGGSPVFSLASNINVKVEPNKDPLSFFFKGSAEPSALTISGSGSLTNYWNKPYGFPIKVGKLIFGTGINFSYDIPVLDNTIMSGEMDFAGVTCEGTIGFDVNQISKNFIQAKIANLDYKKITDFFCGPDIRSKISSVPYLGNFLNKSRLDTAEVRLALQTFSLISYGISKEITQGLSVKGKGNVVDWKGDFAFTLDGPQAGSNMGLSALGKMNNIHLKEGGLTVFKIAAATGKSDPELFVDLTLKHVINDATSAFLSGSNAQATPDRFVYVNGAINILEVAAANMFLELTNQGYNCKMNGNVYGFLNGSIDAQLNFSKPLTSYAKASANTGILWTTLQGYLPKEVAVLGFGNDVWQELMRRTIRIQSMNFEGSLDVLKKNATVNMVYYIGNEMKTVTVTVPVSAAANFFKGVAVEMAKSAKPICTSIQDGIVNAGKQVISGFISSAAPISQTAKEAVTVATSAVPSQTLLNAAPTVSTEVSEKAKISTTASINFFNQVAQFSGETIKMIYNTTKDQIIDKGSRTFDKAKAFFTGADNEELKIVDGPAYWIYVKNQGQVLKGSASRVSNNPVTMGQRSATPRAEEVFQLIPTDEDGSFYLVSSYNGLLVAKPRPTYLYVIPHESDHKKRERMMLEAVPNDPGWFYLKYKDDNIYVEIKTVAVDNIPKLVAAPVQYRPVSDMGKFRFEKAADVIWVPKTFPSTLTPAQPLLETRTYTIGSDLANSYQYTNGVFRLIPDPDIIRAMNIGSWAKVPVPNDRLIGVVLGPPMPSGKNGSVIQAEGDPSIYIMENGKRRRIPDVETFNMMKLTQSMVIKLSKTDLERITVGVPIPSRLIPMIPMMEKALYQVSGDPTVYILFNGKTRSIPDPETLGFMGYNSSQVNQVSAADLSRYSRGDRMPSRKNGALVQESGKPEIYVMENGLRRWIPDIETSRELGLNSGSVQSISSSDMSAIPKGADIPSKK
jgi:hypothetical protein